VAAKYSSQDNNGTAGPDVGANPVDVDARISSTISTEKLNEHNDALHRQAAASTVSAVTPCQRRKRRCMSKRSYQRGTIERHGNNWRGKVYIDLVGSPDRRAKWIVIGTTSMTKREA
jgi:hypothetical protein